MSSAEQRKADKITKTILHHITFQGCSTDGDPLNGSDPRFEAGGGWWGAGRQWMAGCWLPGLLGLGLS